MKTPRESKLLVYWVLVFGISWVSWGLLVALSARKILTYGQPGYMILLVVGGVAPAIAAYLSTLLTERKDGIRAYNRLVFKWRLEALWYAMPLIVLLGTAFVAGGVSWLLGRGAMSLKQPWYTFFPTFAMMIVGGGLEELGWRGLALPELQKKFRPVPATVILGLIWVVWHVPLFFAEGVAQQELNFFWFTGSVMGHAFVLTWLFNKTRSVPLCVAYHAAANTLAALISLPAGMDHLENAVRLLLGIILVAFCIGTKQAGPAKRLEEPGRSS